MKPTQTNADNVFSKYVRLSHSTKQGFCRCVTCGVFRSWKDIDCGHFIKRDYYNLRYNIFNCHPQCKKCNRFSGGVQDEYANYIIKNYGIDVYNDLMIKKHLPFTGYKEAVHAAVIETYLPKVKLLMKAKI